MEDKNKELKGKELDGVSGGCPLWTVRTANKGKKDEGEVIPTNGLTENKSITGKGSKRRKDDEEIL